MCILTLEDGKFPRGGRKFLFPFLRYIYQVGAEHYRGRGSYEVGSYQPEEEWQMYSNSMHIYFKHDLQ